MVYKMVRAGGSSYPAAIRDAPLPAFQQSAGWSIDVCDQIETPTLACLLWDELQFRVSFIEGEQLTQVTNNGNEAVTSAR